MRCQRRSTTGPLDNDLDLHRLARASTAAACCPRRCDARSQRECLVVPAPRPRLRSGGGEPGTEAARLPCLRDLGVVPEPDVPRPRAREPEPPREVLAEADGHVLLLHRLADLGQAV